MLRPHVATTISDVLYGLDLAAKLISVYLEDSGVIRSPDGFFAVALTGDEDPETIREYQEKYQPLKRLLDQIRETRRQEAIIDAELESNRTWHSRQYDIVAMKGDESNKDIASIYRELLS